MSSIQTSKGVLQGSGEGGLTVFRGIPYAQAPVRDLRFRAPRPVELWDATRDATDFGHVAPQITNPALDAVMEDEEQTQDEDCLYLNVWTPQLDGAQLPVMVWIHGGAFTIGSGSSPLYDGQHLARRGVVVVTINYRLGALGFLRVPGADGDVEANWGMLDQAAALEWVRDEIASFGGDPGNVTIFGESAGGMSVGSLMASPLARGLFRRAILESGAGHNALTVEEADATAAGFAKELGVASLEPARLRSLPWQQLVEAQAASEAAMTAEVAEGRPAAMRYQPVIDGHFLSQMPIEAMRGGSARDVSTLIGTTGEELKLFSALAPPGTPEPGEEQLARSAAWLISPEGDLERGRALLEQYRQARSARGESTDLKELVMAATTDQFFRVPADRSREPSREIRAVLARHIRQVLLSGDQRRGEPHHAHPVTDVGADEHAGAELCPLGAVAQPFYGVDGIQRGRVDAPRLDLGKARRPWGFRDGGRRGDRFPPNRGNPDRDGSRARTLEAEGVHRHIDGVDQPFGARIVGKRGWLLPGRGLPRLLRDTVVSRFCPQMQPVLEPPGVQDNHRRLLHGSPW